MKLFASYSAVSRRTCRGPDSFASDQVTCHCTCHSQLSVQESDSFLPKLMPASHAIVLRFSITFTKKYLAIHILT